MKHLSVWLLLGSVLTACSNAQPSPTSIPLPTAQIATAQPASPTPTQISEPSIEATEENVQPGKTRYTIDAFLDYELHQVLVEENIQYVHLDRTPLNELQLTIEASRRPDVFVLEDLWWSNGEKISDAQLNGAQLIIALPEPLALGDNISLSISYKLNLPSTPGPFGYTTRQVNLTDWYAFVPPFDDLQGWLIHEPGNAGEHLLYDIVDFDVILRLSDPTLIVAGPDAPTILNTGYHYQLDSARNFALSISPDFVVLTQTVGEKVVQAYVFPEHLAAGQAALDASAQALTLYGELFGSYHHRSLSSVEIDFEDGLESDALFFLGQPFYEQYDGTVQNYLVSLSAHEVAHNWWFGVIGNDQAQQPWLDEALATYSEYLYYERLYPELADWWWDFRIQRFAPQGFVDSTVYDHPEFSPYVKAVYFRGAQFLHELRGLIGDEAFFFFLRGYAERYRGEIANSQVFFSILDQYTDEDYSALLSEYFKP